MCNAESTWLKGSVSYGSKELEYFKFRTLDLSLLVIVVKASAVAKAFNDSTYKKAGLTICSSALGVCGDYWQQDLLNWVWL